VARILSALIGAVLITLGIFLFMHSLIQRGKEEGVPVMVFDDIEVVRHAPPETPPEEIEAEVEHETIEEPNMEPLAVSLSSPAAPVLSEIAEAPALDPMGDISIATVGDRWSAPLGVGGVSVGVSGGDAHGYVEVVPFNTRRPNVPESAWQNKINGWVLVAFSVTSEGRTRDVRVLDARPRGVFEEAVIAAVEDWTYQISFSSESRGEVILTQRVEVLWSNYPQNLPNVD
jgi:protein TonB